MTACAHHPVSTGILCTLVLIGVVSLVAPIHAQEAPVLLRNGDFELLRDQPTDASGIYANWTLTAPPRIPEGWTPNSAYPGTLEIVPDAPHSGQSCVRIGAAEGKTAHLYQMSQGFEGGKWYRVSLWIRGGPLTVSTYEYFAEGPIRGQTIAQGSAGEAEWRQLTGFYSPPVEGYIRSALALCVSGAHSVDVDDVTVEPLALPDIPVNAPDFIVQNDLVTMGISAGGRLTTFTCKQSGVDYAAHASPFPILTARHRGIDSPVYSLTRDGDLLHVQFLDPDVTATLRITPRKQHFLIEVLSIEPGDVDALLVDLPLRRLKTAAGAFNATYDDDFGACLFGTTLSSANRSYDRGPEVRVLGASCSKAHGIANAKLALIGAPFEQFKPSIMEAERENGLPCPMLEGEWARHSEAVRRSYLFATSVHDNDIDTLIEYAKTGGFGTIIILKNDWLANHGHYNINLERFPEGIDSLRAAVDKIHRAGLHAGVHVFGPSISPNDPYITPVPDDRLAFVPVPPLTEGVDEKATTLSIADKPKLPPHAAESRAFPGHFVRIGDEIVQYGEVSANAPYQLLRCKRGALGTTASAHPAGGEVKGLLTMWGFFLVDPDTTLADELTQNFADVINTCDFDMVYFDASDGSLTDYIDRDYYLNKMHLLYYAKFKRDVLYQTSNGTGSNIMWHIVPRSASADGHGDIKGYLDQRWPGILGQRANWTRSDIGWYYWFKECRPDQIEYVCARALGIDGSISLETSRTALETLGQSQQMMEMIGRWERARRSNHFPQSVKDKLLVPGDDFRLFDDGKGGWRLYRAVYEEPAIVDELDGAQNEWTIASDLPGCTLGVDIVRGTRLVSQADYADPAAVTVETFDDASGYATSETNDFEKFVLGGDKVLSDTGPVSHGLTQAYGASPEDAKVGQSCMVYSAQNRAATTGWGGIGRRFGKPLDLSAARAIALWMHGDSGGETIRIQFRDSAGRNADFLPVVNFTGWRKQVFPTAGFGAFDWSKVEYLLFYFNNVSPNASVEVRIDDVRALPALAAKGEIEQLGLTINGKEIIFPRVPEPGQAITCEGPAGNTFWPGGMTKGQPLELPDRPFELRRGKNAITLTATPAEAFPGDMQVLLYRMWPMEE